SSDLAIYFRRTLEKRRHHLATEPGLYSYSRHVWATFAASICFGSLVHADCPQQRLRFWARNTAFNKERSQPFKRSLRHSKDAGFPGLTLSLCGALALCPV